MVVWHSFGSKHNIARLMTIILVFIKLRFSEANINSINKYVAADRECPTFVDPRVFFAARKVDLGTPGRAPATLPSGFELQFSRIQGAGMGVFANTFIPKHTWLGEYEGEFVPLNRTNADYAWIVKDPTGRSSYYVDALDVRMSNWLRYINCARHVTEENVLQAQCYGRIYYRTKRDLAPGEELLVFYGFAYAHLLGIDVKMYFKPSL